MGRQGKKYRLFSKGAKKATPRPPLVRASRIPWDTVDRNKNPNSITRDACASIGSNHVRHALRKTANAMECDSPRWPKRCP
jgi:hypothetical protein